MSPVLRACFVDGLKWGLTEGSQKGIEARQKPLTLVKLVSKIAPIFVKWVEKIALLGDLLRFPISFLNNPKYTNYLSNSEVLRPLSPELALMRQSLG